MGTERIADCLRSPIPHLGHILLHDLHRGGEGVRKLRINAHVRKTSGIFVALAGLLVVARVMPGRFWLFLLGAVFIYAGWHLYSED